MIALLKLLGWKDAIYCALGFLLVAGFATYTFHERKIGEAHELAAVAAQTKKLQADTDRQTAELKAKSQMEHDAYEKEILALSNQPVDSVRMCNAAGSGAVVPPAGAAAPGAKTTGSATIIVQHLPAGNPGSGPGTAGVDIGPMLDALAAAADRTSAALREFQQRE